MFIIKHLKNGFQCIWYTRLPTNKSCLIKEDYMQDILLRWIEAETIDNVDFEEDNKRLTINSSDSKNIYKIKYWSRANDILS